MQNLLQNMMDSVSLANDASNVTFEVLTGEVDVPVVHDGKDIPTLATRVRDYIDQAVAAGELDGEDGVSIESLRIDPNDGELYLKLESDNVERSLGKIIPEDGVGIEKAHYDETTGELQFEREDGTMLDVGNIRGTDGHTIFDAYISGNNLFVRVRDSEGKELPEINAGDISVFGGISANDVEIKENGNLTIIFSDGTTKDLGQVVGNDGKPGPAIQSAWLNQNGQLQFMRSDSSQFATNPINVNILDGSGNTIEDVKYDDTSGELSIKLSASPDYEVLGVIKGEDGRPGEDGVVGKSVESVSIQDGQLLVKLTEDSAPNSVGKVVFYEAGDNSLNITQAKVIDDETDPNDKMLEIEVDINGTKQTEYLGPVIGEKGTDGTIIQSAAIDPANYHLIITDDAGTPYDAGEVPQVNIAAIDIDEDGRIVAYRDEAKTDKLFSMSGAIVKGKDGLNGFGITDITKSADGSQIIFEITNPDTGDVTETPIDIAVPYETTASVDANNFLKVSLSDGEEFDRLVKLDGDDGEFITDLKISAGKLEVTTNKKSTSFNIDYRNPSQFDITNDNRLQVQFSDGSSPITTTERVAALDGDGITDIILNGDNSITIEYTEDNGKTPQSQTIPYVKGTGITNLDISRPTGGGDAELTFDTTDGKTHTHTIKDGKDGYTIKDAIFESSTGDLKIIHTNPSIAGSVVTSERPYDDGNHYELVITDVKGTTIDDIKYLTPNPTTGDNEIQIILSNSTSVSIPELVGTDADGIKSIDYDETRNRLELTTTMAAPNDLIIIENFVGTDGDRIESIEPILDPTSGEKIGFEVTKYNGITQDETKYTFDIIRGVDGFGMDVDHVDGPISIDDTGYALTVRTNDGNSMTWPQVRGEDATLTLTDITAEFNTTTNQPEIKFTDSDNVTHTFVQQKGVDATETLRDITFDGTTLVIEHIDNSIRDEFRVTDFKGIDGVTIEDIFVNAETGNLEIKVSDREEVLVFEQIKGRDGNSMTDVSLVDNNLVIKTDITGQDDIVINETKGVDGVTIEDIKVVDSTLEIKVSDREEVIRFDQMKGKDGVTITDVSFDERDLIIESTLPTSPTRIPLVKGKDGVTIEDITFDDVAAELQINLSDRTEPLIFPQVKGKDGDGITSFEYIGNELVIYTTLSDDPINIPLAEGISGEVITDVKLNEDDPANAFIEITTTNSPDPVKLDIIKGIDGKGITGIQLFQTGDMIISTDYPDNESLVIQAVKGKDGDSVTDVTFDDVNRNLDIKHNNGELDVSFNVPEPVDGDTITKMAPKTDDPTTLLVETLYNQYEVPMIFGVDGKDGMNIASFEVDKPNVGDLSILMDDDTDADGNPKTPTTHVLEGYAKKVEGISINENDQLEIKYVGIETPFVTTESVVGRDGNGRGIDSMAFDNGELSVTYVDATGVDDTPTVIGSVAMNNVLEAKIDETTGMLTFVMDDNSERDVGVVYGRDGRFVESVRIDDVTDPDTGYVTERHLIMILNNGDEINSGNIKGDAGRSILPMADPTDPASESGVEVLPSGDLVVRYDNGESEPVGNIGGGMGLTVWDSTEKYVLDRVVIHDGGMYMSKISDNTDEPPSENWSPLALGDQITEARKPVIEFPKDGATSYSLLPRLVASEYAAIVSSDERDYREYQVTLSTDTEFLTPLYTANEDSDAHDVRDDLNFGEEHIWRCRDRTKRGSFSAWSDPATFIVPPGRAEKPTLGIHELEDINATFNAPLFVGSTYENLFNSETHATSDWQILKVNGIDDTTGEELTEEVYFKSNDADNLESFTIPYDLLTESTNYKIRVKYRATTIESLWSDWVEFTTEDVFTYISTPAIAYEGSETEVKVFNPLFKMSEYQKTERFSAVSVGVSMPHTSSDWETRLVSSNALIELNENDVTNLREYPIQASLENETRYLIRGRFFNERFGYSQWSEWLEFRTRQEISQPTVSFEDDTIMSVDVPDGAVLVGSPFTAINETHVSSDWIFLDIENGDVEVFSSKNDTTNLTTYTISYTDLGIDAAGKSLKVLLGYNGDNISSELSPQTFVISLFT